MRPNLAQATPRTPVSYFGSLRVVTQGYRMDDLESETGESKPVVRARRSRVNDARVVREWQSRG